MNEMNDLETLLNSWAPRRPSAKIARRLFARPQGGGSVAAEMPAPLPGFRFVWMAPAMACLLLSLVIVGQRSSAGFSHSNSSMPIVAMILSNQSYACIPSSFHQEQNSLRNTFEWTNLSPTAAVKRGLSPIKEND